MASEQPRTVVLGFDALDFTYLDRFADSLPNFAALREAGVECPLESTMPPWTGSAWPSMYTGTDPSHHGVYDFFTYGGYPDESALVSRNDVKAPALWNYLSSVDATSLVLNVPVTHPAEAINGALIPGYLAPEDAPGYPEDIRDEVSDAIGEEYRIYSRDEISTDPEEKLAGYLELIDLRRRAAVNLLTTREWDVAILQVQKTDSVFHNFHDEAAFERVYKAADNFLGSVLDCLEGPVNVVVCSDHGIGRKRGYTIYLNEILRQHGYVEVSQNDGQSATTLYDLKPELIGDIEQPHSRAAGPLSRAAMTSRSLLEKVGVTPGDIYNVAERFGVGDALLSVTPESVRHAATLSIDWRQSVAYCRSNVELGVRINLAGREPDGVVSREEYDSVRAELIALLEGITTPDGEPAFELVARREDVYSGPYLEEGCDIVVVPAQMQHVIDTKLYGRQFVGVDKYDHEPDGVFIGAGPSFDTTAELPSLSLTDVAPVVMALLRFPVPSQMTGEVPPGLLTTPTEVAAYDDVAFAGAAAVTTDDEGVTERLQDLGYL